MASTPVAAVTAGGTLSVSAGSTIAMSASISALSVAILARLAGSVTRARVPTSEPVPAVVGTCTRPTRRAGARPGPEMSESARPVPTSTATSLARSMAEPPPNPTIRSAPSAAATAACRLAVSGSGTTVPKQPTDPSPSRSSRCAFTASAMTKGARKPRAATHSGRRARLPSPKCTAAGRRRVIGRVRSSAIAALRVCSFRSGSRPRIGGIQGRDRQLVNLYSSGLWAGRSGAAE